MRLITVTIKAAFQDAYDVSAEAVREVAWRAVSDGLDAEVCYTEHVQEQQDPTPDPDLEGDAFEVWQEHAREQLDAMIPSK